MGGMTSERDLEQPLDQLTPTRIDFAWRCHNAQESWTAKIDTKASILLTVNLVGFGALLSIHSSSGGALREILGWPRIGVNLGTALVGLAVIASVAVVFPLLGPTRRRVHEDVIYFGHLRNRVAGEVARQIASLSAKQQIDQLSRQLVVMARTNWIKYRTFQFALLLAVLGYACAGGSLVMR